MIDYNKPKTIIKKGTGYGNVTQKKMKSQSQKQ
jgi:hypothetical protein